MSAYLHAGDHGPDVGPDEHGPSGPAWVITATGHTVRGWPWFVIRKRGGRRTRVTVHGNVATDTTIRSLIDEHVRRLQPPPTETGE